MTVSRGGELPVTRKLIRIALISSGLTWLAGCGGVSTGPAVKREMAVMFTPEQAAAIRAVDGQDYSIRRGDTLGVRDLINEVLNQDEVLVLPDGSASFFGLAPIRVAGMTVGELDSLLTQEYGKEFRDPRVSVAVRELGSSEIYVLGEVRMPGKYEIPKGGFSILAAVASAGGFAKDADDGSLVLVRMTPQGYLCREIDLSNFAAGRSFDPAVADLQPFDVVYVSRSAIGDFAAFTSTVVTSLLSYTGLAVDVKYVTEGDIFRR